MPQEVRAFLEKCLLKIEAVQLLLRRFGLCGSLSTKGAVLGAFCSSDRLRVWPHPSSYEAVYAGLWAGGCSRGRTGDRQGVWAGETS